MTRLARGNVDPPVLASVAADEEEAREQLQARLRLLALVTFLLSSGFLLAAISVDVVSRSFGFALERLPAPGRAFNGVGAIVSGALLAATARGRRTPRTLLALDAGATVLATLAYAVMALEGERGMAAVLLASLTTMLVLVFRAVLVPSTWERTVAIGLAAAAIVLVMGTMRHIEPDLHEGAATRFELLANLGLWTVCGVVAATSLSWVLFGLRRQVRDARRLGQYTLEERLGAGGMGIVYRARHAFLRRPTAVKLLPPTRADAATVDRFEREVQHTAALVHPNTIRIYDYGRTADGVFYYAMELLDGADLEAVVEATGPLSPARAIYVLAQIAASLSEAHESGLVHRDVKPANVLLCARGVPDLVKVLDFGLVKEVAAEGDASIVVGTPLFLAPEAIESPADVGPASDLYAVGAVGYYLLTGAHVFDGDSVAEILAKQIDETPMAPSARRGAPLPEDLERLVLACLAKAPGDRPKGAAKLRDALLACADASGWSEAHAREWWAANGDRVTGATARPVSQEQALASTMAVDLERR